MVPLTPWWPKMELKISQLFEELQGSNSEIKQITPKPITETYFDTNLSMFGWAGLPVAANMDFKC